MLLRKKSVKYFLMVILLICLYVLFETIQILFYSKVNELVKADAAIVLGAGIWGDEPSPVFKERINHGIWLYENGYVNQLIFTGGKADGNLHSDASIAKKYAMECGVAEEDIYIEEQSTITQENLYYAAQIINEKNMSKVIIVSDPLHMKRAMLMAEDYGLEAYSSSTPSSMYKSWKSKIPFLAREVFFYIGYKIYRIFHLK